MYEDKSVVRMAALIEFMKLVVDTMLVFDQKYSFDWHFPKNNLYVDKYKIVFEKKAFVVEWVNPNGELHSFIHRSSPFKLKFLNDLYFRFVPNVATTDSRRFIHVLQDVIFPDFCDELGLDCGDINNIVSDLPPSTYLLCAFYKNFFNEITVDSFVEMFHLDSRLSKDSIAFIRNSVSE